MSLIELLYVLFALLAGSVAAFYAHAEWGIWAGIGAYVLGVLSFVGVLGLMARLFGREPRRCGCGKCEVSEFVSEIGADGEEVRVYDCGRRYRVDGNRQLHLLTEDPGGEEVESV